MIVAYEHCFPDKSVDKNELNDSAKMRRHMHSNGSVFSSLFGKYNGPEEMQDLVKQNLSDKALQNCGEKGKRKIQKEVQKIIRDRKVRWLI